MADLGNSKPKKILELKQCINDNRQRWRSIYKDEEGREGSRRGESIVFLSLFGIVRVESRVPTTNTFFRF